MKEWMKRWGPAIVIMGIIFVASNTPGSDIPKFGVMDIFVKKGGHMCGYALLAAAYLHALDNGKRRPRLLFMLTVLLAILYAASDEFHQSFTPGRTPAVTDVCIDAIGGIIGITVLRLLHGRFSIKA
jgi:VanZ family protein